MVMAIYDLSGIQSYIFATNKMKEMIGASLIVNEALFENIPNLFGEERNNWVAEANLCKPERFKEIPDKGKIIYIGGGNALVMFRDEVAEKDFTYRLQKEIFVGAGGALKLCSASINIMEDENLSYNQKKLMDQLDENKRKTPNVSTAKGFSINSHDNITFEPQLLFQGKFASKSKYLKRNRYYRKKRESGLNIFEGLEIGDINITDSFDKFQDESKKNYLAVIHIDGNTMGIRIREFVKAQTGNVFCGLNALSKLSAEINAAYKDVLSRTVIKVYSEKYKDLIKNKKPIPFRPVIVDGDDVTVVCAATDAFMFVDTFMTKLNETKLDSFKNLENSELTAAAGVSFVNVGFPFHTAYEIAEECCKNAKKMTMKRGFSGDDNKSSMDYQICYSGVTGSVSDFRKENYVLYRKENDGKEQHILNIRPYIFIDEDIIYSYQHGFKKTEKAIVGKIARSKLKGLRNEYGKSVLAVETYGDFLLARAEDDDIRSRETAKLLSKPFYDGIFKEEQKITEYYAKFFDVLDVLDFIESEADMSGNKTESEGNG